MSCFIIDQNKKKKTKPEYDVPFIERWPSLKPFVNGGLAAFLQGLTLYVPFAAIYYCPLLSPIRRSPRFLGFNILAKSCPDGIVIRTLSTSLQLGLFETLRNKAIATNDGMALTLYREAACGLIAGAAEAYFSFPFVSACLPQVDPTTLSVVQRAKYRNIFDAFYSMSANRKISALWTNAGPYVKTRMGTNVGMQSKPLLSQGLVWFKRNKSTAGCKCGFSVLQCSMLCTSKKCSSTREKWLLPGLCP
ncbi:putative mitochondrial carrier domain-containing protein [Rosa chinensis]|uniref:Putative mitochondrial carrier domain-containing protein n=1 Tax=Rosa chinensis TaxID=74649 RepID=A0A2P6QNL5_ROSCH|nr:mitochondrial dicarboxylate/tricarboxylate transporter DTC [Rosa chinensis]PRQ35758.1 putative mitochondrial carrier domain-containing protein [Rosa chinensis]